MNRNTRRLLGVTATAAASLCLAACGSSSEPDDSLGDARAASADRPASAAGAAGVDPCTLVDAEQLRTALGGSPTQDGPAAPSSGGSACKWTFATAGAVPGTLTITAWRGGEFFTDVLGKPLSGLGDDARVDPGLGAVLFRSGEDVVQVQVLPSARVTAAREIARRAEEAL